MNPIPNYSTEYIVRLDEHHIEREELGHLFKRTIIKTAFCGRLVNISASTLYFEIGENNDVIIIPHTWVKWMAPVDKEKERLNKKEYLKKFKEQYDGSNGCG